MRNIVLKLLIILVLVWGFLPHVNAWIDPRVEVVYISFINKLEAKYSAQKSYDLLKTLDKKLLLLAKSSKTSTKNKAVIDDLLTLNTEKLWFLDNLLKNIDLTNQKLIEKSLKDSANSKLNKIYLPSYIKNALWENKQFIYIDDKSEFIEDGKFKKLHFAKYYGLDSSNIDYFKNKSWYIVKKEWENEYLFVENYTLEEKIPYSSSSSLFKRLVSEKKPYFIEFGVYYSYNFLTFSFFSDKFWFYSSDLILNGDSTKDLVLYLDENWRFNFVSKYEKVKLISEDILTWTSNKDYFLKELASDKKFLYDDTDTEFIKLRDLSKSLNKGLPKEEAIKKTYAWIIQNIDYTKEIDLKDYKIFSWIKTFTNKDWVCDWYVKLMTYILLFSWYDDIEAVRWYVIDAQDFPQVWHAWLRIGDKYYDPTFDDPIGAIADKKYEDYSYFGLPKDLFYTNRYDYKDLPKYLKTDSLDLRKSLVFDNLYDIASKYKTSNYNLLKPFQFRLENGFNYSDLTIADFKKVLPSYKNYSDLRKDIYMSNPRFFTLTDKNIESIVKNSFNYNLEWLYIYDWELDNWKIEYRLVYDADF